MKVHLLLFFFTVSLFAEAPTKQQVIYLAQTKDCVEAIRLYRDYKTELGSHDFQVLEQIALSTLEHSAKSPDPEKQILGMFGYSIAGVLIPPSLVTEALTSSNPQTQLAALQFLANMQEDEADLLLNKAMSSQLLLTRLEAAYILSQKKAKTATGQIESLMYRLPIQMRSFFPEFFAIIGSSESIHILRHLIDDSFHPTRVNAILSAAKYGRDDLLPAIRASATHLNAAEQEASAAALGILQDSHSLKKLRRLSKNSNSSVRLAALQSLYLLGDLSSAGKIAEEARTGDLFAINLLGHIPSEKETLVELLKTQDLQLKFNVILALLEQKDPRSIPPLLDFLIRDSRDLGFQPVSSIGGSLRAWKVIHALRQKAADSFLDIQALSLSLREKLVADTLEVSEKNFLFLAKLLFDTKQHDLVPKIVSLLENSRSLEAVSFLKQYSTKVGAPLIRGYCNLALFKIGEEGPYKELVHQFIKEGRSEELIRFRPTLPWNLRLQESPHTLTPEENSALIIHFLEVLTQKQEPETIDLILDLLETGLSQNRPVLSGILLHALH